MYYRLGLLEILEILFLYYLSIRPFYYVLSLPIFCTRLPACPRTCSSYQLVEFSFILFGKCRFYCIVWQRLLILSFANIFLFSCLNFWDEAWWFLSLRVFGLLFSSLLLFPQRFGRYVLRPSSGVCRNRDHSRNFELRPLLNLRGSPVRIPLAITGSKC